VRRAVRENSLRAIHEDDLKAFPIEGITLSRRGLRHGLDVFLPNQRLEIGRHLAVIHQVEVDGRRQFVMNRIAERGIFRRVGQPVLDRFRRRRGLRCGRNPD